MGKSSSSIRQGTPPAAMSAGKAILTAHAIVTVPVLILLLSFYLLGRNMALPRTQFILFLLLGCVIGWLWWSFVIPRWRRWAHRHGAPADQLQKLGVMTGLLWPKGWIFEKTEFKVDDE